MVKRKGGLSREDLFKLAQGCPGVKLFDSESSVDAFKKGVRHGQEHLHLIGPYNARFAEITQLSGVMGSGRTTLCLQVCIETLLKNPNYTILYLDTMNNVATHRFKEMIANYLHDPQTQIPDIDKRFILIKVVNFDNLWAMLNFEIGKFMDDSTALLVVDDISTPFKSLHSSLSLEMRIQLINQVGIVIDVI